MIKELQRAESHSENLGLYYSPEYNEPLLEYVEILAEKYKPISQEDWECGFYKSRAIGDFAIRYLDNEVDKRALKKYLDDKDLLNTIEAFGYDIEKFWYLCLFILDFSTGMCISGMKLNKSPREYISNLAYEILQNIESVDFDRIEVAKVKESMELVLAIDGKHKTIIADLDSLFYIAMLLNHGLAKFGDLTKLNQSHTEGKYSVKDGKIELEYDPLSEPKHIWFFAKMFLLFFEILPPRRKRKTQQTDIRFNKMLLVSRLIYLVGLTRNEEYETSDERLKGLFKRYRNLNLNMANSYYM
jgi:hypothetical protein